MAGELWLKLLFFCFQGSTACARCSCNIILFIYLYYSLVDVYQDVLVGSVRAGVCAYFLFFTMDIAWASVRGAGARRRCLFRVRMCVYIIF